MSPVDRLADAAADRGSTRVGAVEPHAQAAHVARFVDALLHLGHDRGRLQQVGRGPCPAPPSLARAPAISRTVIRPSGLSSRTTSPVSVTHDVVCRPANCHVDAERRHGRRSRCDRATHTRACRRRATTGALRSVAGSKIVHSWRAPALRPPPPGGAPGSATAPAARPARALRCACRSAWSTTSAQPRPVHRAANRRRRRCRDRARTRTTAARRRDPRARWCGWRPASSRRGATSAAARPPAARSRRRSATVWLTVNPIFSPR